LYSFVLFLMMMIPPEWMNEYMSCLCCCCFSFFFFSFLILILLNQSKRIGHRCRPSCLISILNFQTMIIHAVSLSPHS
jgi:hypothetical protein